MTNRWSRSLGKWRQLRNDFHLTQWLSFLRSDDQTVEAINIYIIDCNRDHNGNNRVYPTTVKNGLGQMPIHIAAMNKKCAQMVIQLLAHDEPTSLTTVSLTTVFANFHSFNFTFFGSGNVRWFTAHSCGMSIQFWPHYFGNIFVLQQISCQL